MNGDAHGSGRDFIIVTEREAPCVGHRPAGKEFREFLARLTLVVTVGSAFTSQLCSRGGAHLDFPRCKSDKPSKRCKSAACKRDAEQRREAEHETRKAPPPPPPETRNNNVDVPSEAAQQEPQARAWEKAKPVPDLQLCDASFCWPSRSLALVRAM